MTERVTAHDLQRQLIASQPPAVIGALGSIATQDLLAMVFNPFLHQIIWQVVRDRAGLSPADFTAMVRARQKVL